MQVIFIGVGEVGHHIIKHIIASPAEISFFQQVSIILVDDDEIETRNPSYSDFSAGTKKVAAAGYELGISLGMPIKELPFIPLFEGPRPEIIMVPKRVGIKEINFIGKNKKSLILESTDDFKMQNVTGLHVHTGSVLGQHIGFSIRYGKFHIHSAKREIGDCPLLFSEAARLAAEPAVGAIKKIIQGENTKFAPIIKIIS